jgi:hypothetical protein
MAHDIEAEDRIRELMGDPGWSLPAWPDPCARIRKTARRQRLRITTATAGASAVTAAVVVATLAAFQPGPAARPVAYGLPAVGAAGFPASLYPAANLQPVIRPAGRCPSPAGVELPTAAIRTATVAVVTSLGSSFRSDLRSSDRAYWPQVQSRWRSAPAPASVPARVTFAGPLSQAHAASGVTSLARAVRISCGTLIARGSWLVVTRQAAADGKPGTQTAYLLLDRDGRVLVWHAR